MVGNKRVNEVFVIGKAACERAWHSSAITAALALFASILPLPATVGDELVKRAMDALRAGNSAQAMTFANEATQQQPTNAQAWFIRGILFERKREHTNAIANFDRAARLDPKSAVIFQHRGAEHFRGGNFENSIADFDRVIELMPSQAPHHWQR